MPQCNTAPHRPALAIWQGELSLWYELAGSLLPAFILRAAALLGVLAALLGGAQASAADWAKSLTGYFGGATRIMATARDSAGNVYVAGYHSDTTLTMGSSTLTRIGSQDVLVAKLDASGTVSWAKGFGGSGSTASATGIAVDGAGNVYVSGKIQGAAMTSPAVPLLGSTDAFVIKLDAAGTSIWAKGVGGRGADVAGNAVAVDSAGNVILVGNFQSANLTTPALSKIGDQDVFAIKFDATGATLWTKNYGGAGARATGSAVTVDGAGKVYLGGNFSLPALTTPALTAIGSQDGFAFKLDSDGTTLWAKNFGGAGATAYIQGIAVGAGGEVYLGGYFQSADLTTPALTRIGTFDAMAVKLDSDGTTLWAKNFGGAGARATGAGIAIDGSGNVLLGGYFTNADMTTPALAMAGTRDVFAIKLSAAGTTVWAKRFGGSGAQTTGLTIAADGSDNVYVGGYFQNANLTTPALAKYGTVDAFLFKLDASGATTWAKAFAGVTKGSDTYVTASAVDGAGNTYVAGYFNGVIFPLGNVTLSRIGSQDAFVAKFDSSGSLVWAKNFGGSAASTFGQGIALGSGGSVLLTGYFQTANLTTPALTRIGTADAFAIKLDANGASVWAKNFGGAGASAYGYGIAVDGSDNVLVGGHFQSADLTTPALTRIGTRDAFAIKLDAAGTSLWAKSFGGAGAQVNGSALAVDGSGNVYLGGYFAGANLTTPAMTAIGASDAYALKLDANGSTVWCRNYGGSGATTQVLGIALDGSGNPLLGGSLSGANLTTPALSLIGINDAFALKLDGSGTTVWAKNFGGSGARTYGNAIAADSSGNVYLGGYFYTASLTNPALPLIGANDAFALKLDSTGTLAWSKNYGGSGAVAQGKAIAADSAGNLSLGGYFQTASLTTPALTLGSASDGLLIRVATVAPVVSSSGGLPSVIYASRNVETTLNGTTPVDAMPGSTLIVTGLASAGARITLRSGGSEGVTLKIGNAASMLRPLGGDALLILKLVRVNGKDTLVPFIESGSLTIESGSGQPMMALADSVVNAAAEGVQVTSDGARLAVGSGSVTLTGEANGFADAISVTVYAGEVAEHNAAGKITLRIGSLTGSAGVVGDPLQVMADRSLPSPINLAGKLGRLGGKTPLEALAAGLGQANIAQAADGMLGPGISALPVALNLDISRADGVSYNGFTEVAKNGVVFRLVPVLNDLPAFVEQVNKAAGAGGAGASEDSEGMVEVVSLGRQYVVRPGVALQTANGADGFALDEVGNLLWSRQGRVQTLYPVVRFPALLRAELTKLDPAATLGDNGDGSYAITLAGRKFGLRPDLRLLNLFDFPRTFMEKSWWLDGGKIFLNYGNLTAQGMVVK